MDWYLEVTIQARDRQYSFCLLIPETKIIKILQRLTSLYHVVHNTCTMHGRDIKTRHIGSTSILQFRKDCSSIRLDRTQSSFKKHFQLIVFQKLLDWKLEKSYTTKYTCHLDLRQRSHWNTNGKENWVSEVARQPEGEVARQAKFFQPTQPTPNPNSW